VAVEEIELLGEIRGKRGKSTLACVEQATPVLLDKFAGGSV
jgi:hypothetical protein